MMRSKASLVVLVLALGTTGCSLGQAASPSSSESMAPTADVSPSQPDGSTPTPELTAEPTSQPTSAATPGPTVAPTPGRTPSPTVVPAPTPTPAPTRVPPTSTPATTGKSILVTNHPCSTPCVALTYDMGGRVGDALAIVHWLIDHGVHATIFMTGAMADNTNTDAGRLVLGLIQAHPDLFDLGNHSYSHPDFRDLTAAQIRSQLSTTQAALGRYCSVSPLPLFRPPSGGWNDTVLATVGATGYSRTIMWDVDTIDWRPENATPVAGPTTRWIVDQVLLGHTGRPAARNGSIVLDHLGGYNTYAALPAVVAGLRAKGFQLVTIGEMIGL